MFILRTLFCILVAYVCGYSQQCPKIQIHGPEGVWILNTGRPIPFEVEVLPSQSPHLTFDWIVSVGIIVEGRGTSAIQVDVHGLSNQPLEASVRVRGLPSGCSDTATTSASLVRTGDFSPIDEFAWKIGKMDEGARLDSLGIQLAANSPNINAYIIIDTQHSMRAVKARVERMRRWLFTKRKYKDQTRFVFLLTNSGNEVIRFWLFPSATDICKECQEIK
jgi:hypothetical protein